MSPVTAADEEVVWWPWLLGIAIALGLLLWLLLRRRRARMVLEAWDARLHALEADASWVEDGLTSQVLAMPTTDEAAVVWNAAQPRLLDVDRTGHALVADAPDEQRAATAAELRELLGRLVEAVGADVAAGSSAGADDFRARRAVIDAARDDLRRLLGPVEPPAPHRAEPDDRGARA